MKALVQRAMESPADSPNFTHSLTILGARLAFLGLLFGALCLLFLAFYLLTQLVLG